MCAIVGCIALGALQNVQGFVGEFVNAQLGADAMIGTALDEALHVQRVLFDESLFEQFDRG